MAEGDATMARMLRNMELTQDWEGPRQPNGLPDLSQTPAFGRQGFEAFAKEHGPGVAIDAASMATGPIGRGMSAVAGAMRSAPKLSAALLGALGLGAGTGEAEDATLTKRQQRQLEINRQEQARQLEAERVRAEIEANAQKQAAEQGLAIEMARKQQEDEFARQQAAKESVKPFRERHPVLNSYAPGIAAGVAFGVPFALRGAGTLAAALKAPTWKRAVTGTEEAIAAGDAAKATLGAKELEALLANQAKSQSLSGQVKQGAKAVGAGLTGGVMGTEASLIPSQIDAFSLPAGNPDQEAGWNRTTNTRDIAARVAMLSGLGLGGYKVGGLIPGPNLPIEKAQSLASVLKSGHAEDVATVARNIEAGRPQSLLPQSGAVRLEPQGSISGPSGSGSLGGPPNSLPVERRLSSPQSTGPQSLAAALKGGGTSGQPGASQSSASSALSPKEGHWVRQNREKGKFAEGFKDED
jgi:hypothetical protein